MSNPCFGFPGWPGMPGWPGFPGSGSGTNCTCTCTNPGTPGWPGWGGGSGWPCSGGGGSGWPGCGGGWGGGWGGGGWGGGWGGFQRCNCSCDCTNVDAPNCPRNPFVDCAAVFGGMHRSDAFTFTLASATQNYLLQMDSPLPLRHVGFTPSTLTVQCSGTYEITFFGNFSFSAANAQLSFYVKANGRRIEETQVELTSIQNNMMSFERSVIVRLPANTSLQAFLDTSAPGTLSFPPNGLHLEVTRIGD